MTIHVEDILLVDDTPNNIHLISSVLSEYGYKIRVATNGLRALKAVKAKVPDLILLDILMPGMSGFEVCSALKSKNETQDIPILFISALKNEAEKTAAFSEGGVGYISKPVNEKELISNIKTQLELSRLRSIKYET
jgi:two-component system sensor histidine kinase/response regulator